MKDTYDWKRFWHPYGKPLQLLGGGFLPDPEPDGHQYWNPDVVSFDSIADVPCLVMLGEQGAGKSFAMDQAVKSVPDGSSCLHLDTGEFQTDILLAEELFQSPKFRQWQEGTNLLHLFLDSLDEGPLSVEKKARLVLRRLCGHPLERLRLRIVCRTARWPGYLEEELKELWDGERVKVCELTPLRETDVREAARAKAVDAEEFVKHIYDRSAVSLAARPLTLAMLLDQFRRTGRMSSSRLELMREGCLRLCEELTDGRRETALLSGEERLSVAARIASVTAVCGVTGVWKGHGREDRADGAFVAIAELCHEQYVGEGMCYLTEQMVREVLSTGLFSSRGRDRMGWAHQSYAEFLAAEDLSQHMTAAQIMSLLTDPDDVSGRLVPQLWGVGAWLAGTNQEVFSHVLNTEPELLLESDLTDTSEQQRAELTEAVLKDYNQKGLFAPGRFHCQKIRHPGLAAQITCWINDAGKTISARCTAIEIARGCELREVGDVLIALCLNPAQPEIVRLRAAHAVLDTGDAETKAKLRPLAFGEAGEDPDDELKGCGLQAIWPHGLDAEGLFPLLTTPRNPHYLGSYWQFCEYDVIPHLQPSDLPTALRWAADQRKGGLSQWFEKLADRIVSAAWDHVNAAGVTEALAECIVRRLERRQDTDVPAGREDDRRTVLAAIMSIACDGRIEPWTLRYARLVRAEDLGWLLSMLWSDVSSALEQFIAGVVERVVDPYQPDQLDAIVSACQGNAVLADTFAWLLEPVVLGGDRAKKMQAEYLREKQAQEEYVPARERPLLNPSPAERIARRLEEARGGDLSAWWRLNMDLTLEPDSTHYGNELESDVTVLPGWKASGPDTKAAMLDLAREYVLKQDPEEDKWLGPTLIVNYRPAYAGYRALRLLNQEDPVFLSSMPQECWSGWSGAIVGANDLPGEGKASELLQIAYSSVPDSVIAAVVALIDKDNVQHNTISITWRLDDIWDDRMGRALFEKAKDPNLKPASQCELLRLPLIQNLAGAKEYAESLVGLWRSDEDENRERSVEAGQCLMLYSQGCGWRTVWSMIQEDAEFGRRVITEVIRKEHFISRGNHATLEPEQFADLFIWVVKQYPGEWGLHPGAGAVGPGEERYMWKTKVLNHLRDCGETGAICHIKKELPELEWLNQVLLETETVARRRSWTPPKPADVLALMDDDRRRIVRSGEQLLEVVIESLERFQAKLKETGIVRLLWDKVDDKKWKPVEEKGLSVFVRMHLEADLQERGILVNREVEIRPATGSTPGQETDVLVESFVLDKRNIRRDCISVIVEIKRCWNRGLKIAMKTQLADRYLKDKECQHGLYLVGWFYCDAWTGAHNGKTVCRPTVEEARASFEEQATQLSQESRRIRAFVLDVALR